MKNTKSEKIYKITLIESLGNIFLLILGFVFGVYYSITLIFVIFNFDLNILIYSLGGLIFSGIFVFFAVTSVRILKIKPKQIIFITQLGTQKTIENINSISLRHTFSRFGFKTKLYLTAKDKLRLLEASRFENEEELIKDINRLICKVEPEK